MKTVCYGCESVYDSSELLEVLDLLTGRNKERAVNTLTIEDTILHNRIEAKVRRKLTQKGNRNADNK